MRFLPTLLGLALILALTPAVAASGPPTGDGDSGDHCMLTAEAPWTVSVNNVGPPSAHVRTKTWCWAYVDLSVCIPVADVNPGPSDPSVQWHDNGCIDIIGSNS